MSPVSFFVRYSDEPVCGGWVIRGRIRDRLAQLDITQLRARARGAERELYNLGITFTVYTNREALDRILPFDVIPRVLSSKDWEIIESGVKQRVAALNLFLYDIYHGEKILNDGVVPRELVLGNANYRPEMCGFDPPQGAYVHICGIDIVRDEKGKISGSRGQCVHTVGRCPT